MIRVLVAAVALLLLPVCARAESLALNSYTLQTGPIRIKHVRDNASGLTFCPKTKSLFMVVDEPEIVIKLDLEGGVKRIIPLRGFQDVEGITHVKGGAYAVVEERRGLIWLVQINVETTSIEYSRGVRLASVAKAPLNDGIEGISYDSGNGIFYGIKEINPRKIYSFRRSAAKSGTGVVTYPWDAEKRSLGLRDLSGIYYHAETGLLLILSDESKCVVACTTHGREMGRLFLRAGSAGLVRDIPKPEGIAMDDRGWLYILSEPNLLYVFSRKVPFKN
jgi:uncharacterized protein YjiK